MLQIKGWPLRQFALQFGRDSAVWSNSYLEFNKHQTNIFVAALYFEFLYKFGLLTKELCILARSIRALELHLQLQYGKLKVFCQVGRICQLSSEALLIIQVLHVLDYILHILYLYLHN